MFSFIGGCGAFGSGTESTGTLWDSGGCGKRKPAGNVDSAQSREGKVLSIDCTPERAFRRDALCWDDARYWRWGVIVGAEHECWLKGESLQKRHNRSGFEADMMREFIPVEESFAEWRKGPEDVAAYDALEEKFALASALIKARGDADMTQEQVAAAMGTTQAVVARVESGKTMPSTRTLERFAKATRTKLRIRFEPVRKAAR